MIDETDISREKNWLYEDLSKSILKNLKKLNIKGQYVKNRQEALTAVLNLIPFGVVVGRGDSVTLEQIGILPALAERNQNKIINPYQKDEQDRILPTEERRSLQREALLSDIFLTSINAITLEGVMVSTDGAGNRVAAMIFGPRKVIIVAGVNKIVKDLNAALDRIHTVASPLNIKRHYLKHNTEGLENLPCLKTGKCVNCKSEWRVCRYTVIIEGVAPTEKERIHVVLVGEDLGF